MIKLFSKKLQNGCYLLTCGLIFLGTSCEKDPSDDLSFNVRGNRISFIGIKIVENERVISWSGSRTTDSTIETMTATMRADAEERLVFSPLVDSVVHMTYTIIGADTTCYETRRDEHNFRISKWSNMYNEDYYYLGMFEGTLLNVADPSDTVLIKDGNLYFKR